MSEPDPPSAHPPPDPGDPADHPALEAARRLLEEDDGRTVDQQVELTGIPAPPFREEARAERMAALLEAAGMTDVRTDEVGNVIAGVPVEGDPVGPPIVLSAHLDTVFPEGTDTEVRRNETESRWEAPGIADDGRGLATILAVGRAVAEARVPLRAPLLLAATVGEEGLGDLRGVKHLFRDGGGLRGAGAFVSVDGSGLQRIVHRGVGSRRLRITVRGPGGHSWADWGTPNPVHALGGAVAALAELPAEGAAGGGADAEAETRTTLSVGRIAGGTSVNAIPSEAWLELDLRSESEEALVRLEQAVRQRVREAVEREHRIAAPRRPPGSGADGAGGRGVGDGGGTDAELEVEIEVIGDRPPGRTGTDDPLVRAAVRATQALGLEPDLVASSTDANIPMSVGVPAVTLGGGGRSGRAHTEDEWYSNEGGPEGVYRVLLTVAGAVGLRT